MSHARAIVESFLDAYHRGDEKRARALLADDFAFIGPAVRYDNADRYLKSSAHVAAGFRGLEIQRMFEDGDDVCVFYVLRVNAEPYAMPMAEWFQLTGDRISAIRLIFDTGPFVAPRRESKETAIDPVCQMVVDKRSPPATWVHLGETYYFCNPGCAEAFRKDPEAYLRPS
ncbi:MAG: YHS domain-containing protein [Myxococcaceae bacterium]|nr:YHS domain-containing protein [Myxococcaceae bacterium]